MMRKETTLSDFDPNGPHSRACGPTKHMHGVDCNKNCQTCGGLDFGDYQKTAASDPSTSSVFPHMVSTLQALDVASAALDSENEGIRLAAAQTILRYSPFVRPNDASQASP
jgi:hypothetical protein